jgi:hypothetical protein
MLVDTVSDGCFSATERITAGGCDLAQSRQQLSLVLHEKVVG